MYKILQWNCRGFLSKFAEISNLIRDYHVACFQEIWLNSNNIISFKCYVQTQDFNFLYLKEKEFGIGRVWKDVSDVSLAGQRAMT